MTEETKTEGKVSFYNFKYESVTEGLIASKLPEDETKEKVLAELKEVIGEDFKLVEFREASEEEVAKALFEMGAMEDLPDPASDPETEKPTLN